MKPPVVLFVASVTLITIAGCEKTSIRDYRPEVRNLNLPPVIVSAGSLFVWSPNYTAELQAIYRDAEPDVTNVNWEKISGPEGYVFENKNSASTKVSGLKTGEYEFELTVTDKIGQYDKDTTFVTVADVSVDTNEIVVKNLFWYNDWWFFVELPNFYANIPPGSQFKIFIQRGDDPEWIEVVPMKQNEKVTYLYDYYISYESVFYPGGILNVNYYGADNSDFPDVKIVYQ